MLSEVNDSHMCEFLIFIGRVQKNLIKKSIVYLEIIDCSPSLRCFARSGESAS